MTRRLLAAASLALALGAAVPAHAATPAGVGGRCSDYKVAVACQESGCVPDYPCDIVLCGVWVAPRCVL